MCYNKTRVFDPSILMKAKGHMFETTKQEQMRQEPTFMTEREKEGPFSSKPRQPFQAGGSYKPRWAGGAFEEHLSSWTWTATVLLTAEMAEFEKGAAQGVLPRQNVLRASLRPRRATGSAAAGVSRESRDSDRRAR